MAKTMYQLSSELSKAILEMLSIKTGLDKNDLLSDLLKQGFTDQESIQRTLLWLANQNLIKIQTDLLSEASYYLTNEGEINRKILRHAQITGRRIYKEAIEFLQTKIEELERLKQEQITIQNQANETAKAIKQSTNDTIDAINRAIATLKQEKQTIARQNPDSD